VSCSFRLGACHVFIVIFLVVFFWLMCRLLLCLYLCSLFLVIIFFGWFDFVVFVYFWLVCFCFSLFALREGLRVFRELAYSARTVTTLFKTSTLPPLTSNVWSPPEVRTTT
jgi:hypothetical protein